MPTKPDSGCATPQPLNEDMDAARWAREFIEANRYCYVGAEKLDEGAMIAWFANAIMCGYDVGRRKLRDELSVSAVTTAATPGAYRWIEEAVPFLRDLRNQMPPPGNSTIDAIDSLLMGVPCAPQDLGFDSPGDRYARAWHALNATDFRLSPLTNAAQVPERNEGSGTTGNHPRTSDPAVSTPVAAPIGGSNEEQSVAEAGLEFWVRKAKDLRRILDRCHNAMGESEHSDDESLPDFIETFVREHRQRINELETRLSAIGGKP